MKIKFNSLIGSAPLLAAFYFLLFCGCAGRGIREAPPYPARPQSASELRRIVNEQAAGSRPLKLKGRLTYWPGPDTKPRSCLALIIADPSRRLRVKGYRVLGPTLFDAAADGDELLLYTYSTGEIVKPGDSGEEAFYHKLLDGVMDSLFTQGIGEDEILLIECTPRHYVLSLAGKEKGDYLLEKKIWLNGETLRIAGVTHYDGRGIPLMMATMRDYTQGAKDLLPVPSRITLFWPGDGAFLDIALKSIDRAGTLEPGVFSLTDLKGRK